MGYRDRVTVCISSQVGCAMDCGFCATGQMGLMGNLSAGEIAAQVVWARREAARLPDTTPQRLTNVVFMGMGEPLANYARVRDAITQAHRSRGHAAGRPTPHRLDRRADPGDPPARASIIRRWGSAVSLHAASDELRDELVPINRRYPLAELEAADARPGVRPPAAARRSSGR